MGLWFLVFWLKKLVGKTFRSKLKVKIAWTFLADGNWRNYVIVSFPFILKCKFSFILTKTILIQCSLSRFIQSSINCIEDWNKPSIDTSVCFYNLTYTDVVLISKCRSNKNNRLLTVSLPYHMSAKNVSWFIQFIQKLFRRNNARKKFC